MKILKENTVPVPRRGKMILTAAFTVLMAASVAAGMATAPEETEIPVLLANGEVITPPWYITVDGEKIALVDSQETAQEVLENVVSGYDDSENEVLDIEVREETSAEEMQIRNGDDPPDILTADEAEKVLLSGDSGESYLTVVTTEEQTRQEPVEFIQEYKHQFDMYVGQQKVEQEGHEGRREVTSRIVKENGKQIEEEVLEEELLEEPQDRIILTGTKIYDGYGGGSSDYRDDNVSYDPDAVYAKLGMPISQVYVSSDFGWRWGRMHSGTDFALAQGSDIYAADGGTVYFAGNCGGYGNLVKIDHGNGMQTYYAHCSSILVSQGQKVRRGERIALVGSTGNSTGPHLHFEVIINGSCVDPRGFL